MEAAEEYEGARHSRYPVSHVAVSQGVNLAAEAICGPVLTGVTTVGGAIDPFAQYLEKSISQDFKSFCEGHPPSRTLSIKIGALALAQPVIIPYRLTAGFKEMIQHRVERIDDSKSHCIRRTKHTYQCGVIMGL